MVYVMLADGFEEVEALAPVDMLRRAGVNVMTVGVTGEAVRGSHGIVVAADITAQEMDMAGAEMLVLPGGMPGTLNLEKSEYVQAALEYCYENGIHIAAICAAPTILGHKGYLRGRYAICFPGYEGELNCTRSTSAASWSMCCSDPKRRQPFPMRYTSREPLHEGRYQAGQGGTASEHQADAFGT